MMNFLILLADTVGSFIRRNPVFCIVVLLLALLAPSLLEGVVKFVLYLIFAVALFWVVVLLLLRWRLGRLQREMGERFGRQGGGPGAEWHRRTAKTEEGEVKVYRTSETPDKRISDDVGDYVDFEETKENR